LLYSSNQGRRVVPISVPAADGPDPVRFLDRRTDVRGHQYSQGEVRPLPCQLGVSRARASFLSVARIRTRATRLSCFRHTSLTQLFPLVRLRTCRGIDPDTGRAWKSTWIPKSHCTNPLIKEWKDKCRELKEKKAAAKKAKALADKEFNPKKPRESSRESSTAKRRRRGPLNQSFLHSFILSSTPLPLIFTRLTRFRLRLS
jgi:hypothetical protein